MQYRGRAMVLHQRILKKNYMRYNLCARPLCLPLLFPRTVRLWLVLAVCHFVFFSPRFYGFVSVYVLAIPRNTPISSYVNTRIARSFILYKCFTHLCFLPVGYFCSVPNSVICVSSLGLLGDDQVPPPQSSLSNSHPLALSDVPCSL